MLFSNEAVAHLINQRFEAAWETVRPVPLVQINFGDGNVLTRTLHGNIATYLCNADGRVLDILPGIYTPAGYLENLQQWLLLARYVASRAPLSGEARLRQYHESQAAALKQRQPLVLVESPYISKLAIENPVKLVLASELKGYVPLKLPGAPPVENSLNRLPPDELGNWKLLAEDTRINEMARRQQIHAYLAAKDKWRPEEVTKWLYREVLHADLDDPYLGLGKVLFANYPFEDKVP